MGSGYYALSATVRHPTFCLAVGLRTPLTLLTTVVVPSPTGVCWPTSTDSFPCACRRLTFAPGGRLVRVLASVHTPLCLQWTVLQI